MKLQKLLREQFPIDREAHPEQPETDESLMAKLVFQYGFNQARGSTHQYSPQGVLKKIVNPLEGAPWYFRVDYDNPHKCYLVTDHGERVAEFELPDF